MRRTLPALLALVLVLTVAVPVFAAGGDMPWEPVFERFEASLTGPVLKFGGVAAVLLLGSSFAFGEGGAGFKRALAVAFGLAIAGGGIALLSEFGISGGALL